MDDKYKIMTLKYLYSILDLREYEKKLEDKKIEGIIEENDDFKYFTFLSDGDLSLFTEEEKKQFYDLDKYTLEEMLTNEKIKEETLDFIEKTYTKYYLANSNGEYLYYGNINDENLAPDDALVLGINYKVDCDDNEDYDKKSQEIDEIITDIINDIQFNKAKEKNLKIAVFKNNGIKSNDDILIR